MPSKKIIIAAIILIIAIVAIIAITSTNDDAGLNGNVVQQQAVPQENTEQASQELQDGTLAVDNAASTFEFEGFAPGDVKSHSGTFLDWMAAVTLDENGQIAQIESIFNTDSADTGIGGLNNHLKNEDFFDTANFPQATFTSTAIDTETGQITGDFTFRGITQSITFPAEITENTISAEFFLDTEPHGLNFLVLKEEVRIAFNLVF